MTNNTTDNNQETKQTDTQHTVSGVLGEIVWLMTQSDSHKRLFIGELEWYIMEPMMLSQFRIYRKDKRPIGVVIWAKVDDEVHQRLQSGNTRLRGKEWHNGNHAWIIDVISPFGEPTLLVNDMAKSVFSNQSYHYLQTDQNGVQKMITINASQDNSSTHPDQPHQEPSIHIH